jgi:hypothetical protein
VWFVVVLVAFWVEVCLHQVVRSVDQLAGVAEELVRARV